MNQSWVKTQKPASSTLRTRKSKLGNSVQRSQALSFFILQAKMKNGCIMKIITQNSWLVYMFQKKSGLDLP